MDHECCGAYKLVYGAMTPEEERKKHVENILAFEKSVAKWAPGLTVHAFIMNLDGTVEKLK